MLAFVLSIWLAFLRREQECACEDGFEDHWRLAWAGPWFNLARYHSDARTSTGPDQKLRGDGLVKHGAWSQIPQGWHKGGQHREHREDSTGSSGRTDSCGNKV